MAIHLEPHEQKQLILTIGSHKGKRPLSPVETGTYIRRAVQRGTELKEIAELTQLEGTTQLSRFMKMLALPEDTHHLIDWGKSEGGGVGFTTAFEVARLPSARDQREAIDAVLTHALSSAEARSLVQLRVRGAKSIEECVEGVVKMRPVVEVRRLLIGTITDAELRTVLVMKTQAERDSLIAACAAKHGLDDPKIFARLAPDRFTIVGPDKALAKHARNANQLEAQLNECLAQQLRGSDVRS